MFKKIVVPLDGSENAERVWPWVRLYAKATRAMVAPMRVVDPRFISVQEEKMQLNDAEQYLRGLVRTLNYEGIPSRSALKTGVPAKVIVDYAARAGCDLIAMTTRGRSKVAQWLLGSVANEVLRLSPIPVLLVRSQTELARQARVRRIVVPLDGSALAESIAPWVEGLAKLHRASIVFYHVMPERKSGLTDKYFWMLRELSMRMERRCRRLREEGTRATFNTGRGDAALEILKLANEGPNLIATTTRGLGGFKRWIFGSVAEKVIHGATVPVFVYKTPRAAEREAPEPLLAEAEV